MNDKQASGSAAWGDAWTEMQRKYWDTWSDLTRKAPGATGFDTASTANPWAQGLDFWSKMMGPVMPQESRGWMDKLMELNRGYLQMGETLYKAFSAGQGAGKDLTGWWEMFSQGLSKMQEQIGAGVGATKDPWGGFATLWGLPMDTWKRLSSACSMLPGDMEKAFRDVGDVQAPGLTSLVGGWLSTPTLGYTREAQEEAQRLAQLWLEHAQAGQAYAAVLSRVVVRAGESLRERMLEQAKRGETFDSLRACYDLWVDCGEEAYAEFAGSEEFTRTQAQLTNSLMAVKRQEQKMVDELLGAMNMPTRRELDTSHRRLHQLQRQVWRMQQLLDEAGARELREEVAALQTQLKELSRSLGTADAQSATPVRRTAKPKNVS